MSPFPSPFPQAFYRNKGAKIKNLEVRREFDRQMVDFLKPLNPDVVVYAGYVWATTEPLVYEFMGINCHPADLMIERDGHRAYAGASGVKDALLAGETKLHSTLHLVSTEHEGHLSYNGIPIHEGLQL